MIVLVITTVSWSVYKTTLAALEIPTFCNNQDFLPSVNVVFDVLPTPRPLTSLVIVCLVDNPIPAPPLTPVKFDPSP